MHQCLARRHTHNGRVVGVVQANEHVVALHHLQLAQRARQHGGAHLGATAAAAHGNGRDRLQRFFPTQRQLIGSRCRRGALGRHPGKFRKLAHEVAVNPVFPAPDPVACKTQCATRSHGITVARADERQPAALRAVRFEGLSLQAAPQVVGQRRAHAHGKHAGFLQRAALHGGNVAGGKNSRIGHGLQRVGDLNEAPCVQRQARALQPRRTAGLGDPHDFVGLYYQAVAAQQAARLHVGDLGVEVQFHGALDEHALKATAHPGVVGGQNRGARADKHKRQQIGVAAQRVQFTAQAVLHGQQQFHTPSARAHHGYAQSALGVRLHTCQQRQPALVEAGDGFHRHGKFCCARHAAQARGGTNVDGEAVVGHWRAVAAQHFARGAVDAHHLVAVQAGAGEHGQAGEVDVHLVVAVVARYIAGQHARIRRVHVGADHGQAHAGLWLHAKALEHAHMAVAATDQHNIAGDGLGRGLHYLFSVGFERTSTSWCSAARSVSEEKSSARAAHCVCSCAKRLLLRHWRSRVAKAAASFQSK